MPAPPKGAGLLQGCLIGLVRLGGGLIDPLPGGAEFRKGITAFHVILHIINYTFRQDNYIGGCNLVGDD
jgi:hypothetical protein